MRNIYYNILTLHVFYYLTFYIFVNYLFMLNDIFILVASLVINYYKRT